MRIYSKYYKIWAYIFIVMSISFFVSCSKEQTYQPNKNFHKKPVQTLFNIVLYRSEKGDVYARLNSKTVEYYSGDSARTVFPKGINVLFYNKDHTNKATLTARYAVNYTATRDIVYLRDSIKIINFNNHDTIYCKDLYWEQDKQIVYTHKPIRRYTQGGETFGDGLVSNEQFDSVVVIRPHGKETVHESD